MNSQADIYTILCRCRLRYMPIMPIPEFSVLRRTNRNQAKMRFFSVRPNATLAALLVAAAVGSVQGQVACSPECENTFRSGCMPHYCGQGNTDSLAWSLCQQEIDASRGPLGNTCTPRCRDTAGMALAKFCGCDRCAGGPLIPIVQGQGQGAVQGAVQAQSPGFLSANRPGSPQSLTSLICTGRPRADCAVQLDVPESCVGSSSACPIVFYLHGANGNNRRYASTSGVHTAGYIGVYPQGERGWNTWPKDFNSCRWNDYRCTTDPDEGDFIASIIAELRDRDATGNVYLVGISNGASLAHRLAANAGPELPIKGIVVDVMPMLASPERSGPGRLNYNQPGRGSSPVSVLSVMGTTDRLIPYEGGKATVWNDNSFQLHSALDSMRVWAGYNSCTGFNSPGTSFFSWGVGLFFGRGTKFVYGGCPDGLIVEHYEMEGIGHGAGGVSVDGILMKYDIINDFINRVENPPRSKTVPTTAFDASCADRNEACEFWASTGECEANPVYMSESCTRACDECAVNKSTPPPPAPTATGGTSCQDTNEACEFWASIGECDANPTYMIPFCARSCDTCA